MKFIRLLLALAVVFIVAAALYGGYYLLQRSDIAVPSLFQPARGSRLLLAMDGFQFAQSSKGKIAWRVFASKADLYGNKEAQLKDIEIVFNDPDGSRQAKLMGDSGTMDTSTGNASLRHGANDVKIVTSDGYLLTTKSLLWKAGERLVVAPEAFKLIGSEIYLEGVGLSAFADLRSLVVKNHVKAVLQE